MGTVSATATCPGCCGGPKVCLCYGWVGAETQSGCRTYPGTTADDWQLVSEYDPETDTTTFAVYKNDVFVEIVGTNTGFLDLIFPISVTDGACKYYCVDADAAPPDCYELADGYEGPHLSGPHDTLAACEAVCGVCCPIPDCLTATFEHFVVDGVDYPGQAYELLGGSGGDGGIGMARFSVSVTCVDGEMVLAVYDASRFCTVSGRQAILCDAPFELSIASSSEVCDGEFPPPPGSSFTWSGASVVPCASPMRMRPEDPGPFAGLLMAGEYPDAGGQAA